MILHFLDSIFLNLTYWKIAKYKPHVKMTITHMTRQMKESYLVFNREELLVDILPVSSTELFETAGLCIHYYIKVNQIKYKTKVSTIRFLMKIARTCCTGSWSWLLCFISPINKDVLHEFHRVVTLMLLLLSRFQQSKFGRMIADKRLKTRHTLAEGFRESYS